ncbi:hypothetical protein BDA99DRAFT_542503 [Phascolomyces articulosus]|uniref:Uncharacterized protein n=1 Tax=Phascolomyces articulosus TaxID=60185 RepID=A0AAD5K0L3_9FUNG|nr:hypothetical protein BDA99DRAFT_542503 [Phascolomyces articulosus]
MRTVGLAFAVLMTISAMVSAAPASNQGDSLYPREFAAPASNQGGLLLPRDDAATNPVSTIAEGATKMNVGSLTSVLGPKSEAAAAADTKEKPTKANKCGGSGPGLTDGDECDEHLQDKLRETKSTPSSGSGN